MSDEAVAALKALSQTASGLTDSAQAGEVLRQAGAIAHDTALVPSRALGLAVLEAATALVSVGEPRRVEDLFLQAKRILEAASDARIDDHLLLWRNVGGFYEAHGAIAHRNQTMALIGQAAEHYTGPLERRGADVFLDMALAYRRGGQVEPMLTMLRQVHRHRSSDASAPADRLSWLQVYAQMLLEANRTEDAISVLEQGAALAHEVHEDESEASMLNTGATILASRGDQAGALGMLERARKVIDSNPRLGETQLAAAVLHNHVGRLLALRDPTRYVEAIALSERAIAILQRLGHTESDDYAYALYHRAVLAEFSGDWTGAARGYTDAAAIAQVAPLDAAEWLSLAGRAWIEVEAFDPAAECYLGAIRRRVGATADTATGRNEGAVA
jgi:tetratricopeptide (TPR) repeat protein